jgi:hypothetical protein
MEAKQKAREGLSRLAAIEPAGDPSSQTIN